MYIPGIVIAIVLVLFVLSVLLNGLLIGMYSAEYQRQLDEAKGQHDKFKKNVEARLGQNGY